MNIIKKKLYEPARAELEYFPIFSKNEIFGILKVSENDSVPNVF